ncbi:MAG: glutamine-hydrolyzing carbamoyl-phosphate synthase small subunit [Nannocystaceae bacterium]
MHKPFRACLVLADGSTFQGEAFGATTTGAGEVVFHTGMTGYQEILSDPSYAGQVVCMTCPEIGNVGVNKEDAESKGLFLRGLVVRDHTDAPSSWRSQGTLSEYLYRHGVPGISGVDTRRLVRRIRTIGATNGLILHGDVDLDAAGEEARMLPHLVGQNLVDAVTCTTPYAWHQGSTWPAVARPKPMYRVVAYDFGIKHSILRMLVDAGFEVVVVPAATPAAEALALDPHGIFLSNGPGDPAAIPYVQAIVGELAERKPIFGICLGHQILGLALGARVKKLRFGHHGANHPAREAETGRILITSENHGFALDEESLRSLPELEVTHVNLNDNCIEGIRHRSRPLFSVQFHPEASPGPHDASNLFARFRAMIKTDASAATPG